ncbi:MAG: hypothetical protein KJZ65_01810 [Phycisphaerales bacterium]|nr:hypothetical protein [Phycisphaerales bacterium]
MDAKPWQIGVVVVGLLGGLALLGWQLFGGKEIRRPDEILLMDVITGDRFVADVSGHKAVILPERNPDTQQYTLLPLSQDKDGTWRVRRLDQLPPDLKPEQMEAIESLDAGLAKPSSAKPRPLKN